MTLDWTAILLPMAGSALIGALSAFIVLRTQVAVIESHVEDHARRILQLESHYQEFIRLVTRLETLIIERNKG